jgi:hypothetical protein
MMTTLVARMAKRQSLTAACPPARCCNPVAPRKPKAIDLGHLLNPYEVVVLNVAARLDPRRQARRQQAINLGCCNSQTATNRPSAMVRGGQNGAAQHSRAGRQTATTNESHAIGGRWARTRPKQQRSACGSIEHQHAVGAEAHTVCKANSGQSANSFWLVCSEAAVAARRRARCE